MSKLQKKTIKYKWGKRKLNGRVIKSKPQKQEVMTSQYELRKRILKGYMEMIERRSNEGYDIYLFTFMFNEMPGKERAKIEQMKDEIYHCYSRLATRIAKKPSTPAGHKLLPLIILYPDKAVYKSVKQKLPLKDVVTNEGLHFHGVCAADRRGKINNFLDDYFEEFQSDFITRKLRTVHVEQVTETPGFVTDYALKSFKRPWFEDDDIVVLPRTLSELSK
jgi:hypothetical protein